MTVAVAVVPVVTALHRAGLELADIGWILGTYGFVAGLVGALVGGVAAVADQTDLLAHLVDRVGQRGDDRRTER